PHRPPLAHHLPGRRRGQLLLDPRAPGFGRRPRRLDRGGADDGGAPAVAGTWRSREMDRLPAATEMYMKIVDRIAVEFGVSFAGRRVAQVGLAFLLVLRLTATAAADSPAPEASGAGVEV